MHRVDVPHACHAWRRVAAQAVKRVGFGSRQFREVDWFTPMQADDVSRGQRPRDPRVVMTHEFQARCSP